MDTAIPATPNTRKVYQKMLLPVTAISTITTDAALKLIPGRKSTQLPHIAFLVGSLRLVLQ